MFLGDPKRAQQVLAMLLITDGVIAVISPQTYPRVWKRGPRFWRSFMETLADHPQITRAIGAAEVIGGVLWALHQEESD